MDLTEERIYAQLDQRQVPEHLHDGIALYLIHGYQPGSFLTAIITNDLLGVFKHGDADSVAALPSIVWFFYHDAPIVSWGSVEAMDEWQNAKREARNEARS